MTTIAEISQSLRETIKQIKMRDIAEKMLSRIPTKKSQKKIKHCSVCHEEYLNGCKYFEKRSGVFRDFRSNCKHYYSGKCKCIFLNKS